MNSGVKSANYLSMPSVFFGVAVTSTSALLLYMVLTEENYVLELETVGTVAAAIIGFAFALWRVTVADSQAKIASRRAEMAEAGLNIDRFQRGCDMLANEHMTIRFAGIWALRDLARAEPQAHLEQILAVAGMFVTEKSRLSLKDSDEPDDDTTGGVEFVRGLTEDEEFVGTSNLKPYGEEKRYFASLRSADMRGTQLAGKKFNRLVLGHADLSSANCEQTRFSNCFLVGAKFCSASFKDACIESSEISGADFQDAKDLTPDQLNSVWANSCIPPINMSEDLLKVVELRDATEGSWYHPRPQDSTDP